MSNVESNVAVMNGLFNNWSLINPSKDTVSATQNPARIHFTTRYYAYAPLDSPIPDQCETSAGTVYSDPVRTGDKVSERQGNSDRCLGPDGSCAEFRAGRDELVCHDAGDE